MPRTRTPNRPWTARTARPAGRSRCRGSGRRSLCNRWRPAAVPAGGRVGTGVAGARFSPRTAGRSRRARRSPGGRLEPSQRRRYCSGRSSRSCPGPARCRGWFRAGIQDRRPLDLVQLLIGQQVVPIPPVGPHQARNSSGDLSRRKSMMSAPAARSGIGRPLSRRKQVGQSNSKLPTAHARPFRNGCVSGRQTEDRIFFPVAFARDHIFRRASMRGSYMVGPRRPEWIARRTARIRCEGPKPSSYG